MAQDIEDKVVFAVSPGNGDGVPMVLLGIPHRAYKRMKDGRTSTFDLTKVGLPVKLILYGAENHTAAMKMIEGHMAETGTAMLDERRADFSIQPKVK